MSIFLISLWLSWIFRARRSFRNVIIVETHGEISLHVHIAFTFVWHNNNRLVGVGHKSIGKTLRSWEKHRVTEKQLSRHLEGRLLPWLFSRLLSLSVSTRPVEQHPGKHSPLLWASLVLPGLRVRWASVAFTKEWAGKCLRGAQEWSSGY